MMKSYFKRQVSLALDTGIVMTSPLSLEAIILAILRLVPVVVPYIIAVFMFSRIKKQYAFLKYLIVFRISWFFRISCSFLKSLINNLVKKESMFPYQLIRQCSNAFYFYLDSSSNSYWPNSRRSSSSYHITCLQCHDI